MLKKNICFQPVMPKLCSIFIYCISKALEDNDLLCNKIKFVIMTLIEAAVLSRRSICSAVDSA